MTGLTVTAGQDQLSEYNVSGTYKRFHCATCHTFLYGQVTVAPGIPPYVAASAFDGDVTAGLPINHLFVRSKVSWHEIGDDGPRHDTYPPM